MDAKGYGCFRCAVALGVELVSGPTAGLILVTYDQVPPIARIPANRAAKMLMRAKRFMLGRRLQPAT